MLAPLCSPNVDEDTRQDTKTPNGIRVIQILKNKLFQRADKTQENT